jgi:excisionase family DNA binding protein
VGTVAPTASEGTALTVTEVCRILGVSDRTVRNMIVAGKLPAINVGSGPERPVYRIPADELAAWVEKRRVAPKELA